MDDYSIASLGESKNEWCARLVNIFTPAVIVGLKSIFSEAWTLCKDNDEEDKYLMTFQTFLSRVPKWNSTIIEEERKRISEVSGCGYLEELITCVHIIQLKALTCVRVGQKQKKIDIDIPSVDNFVHKVYISVARKLYTNIYLFEKNIAPLQIQKHNRELEIIINECVLNTVRDTMPVEMILRAYMDETEEQDVEIKEEEIIKEVDTPPQTDNTDTTETNSAAAADSTTQTDTTSKEEEQTPFTIENPSTTTENELSAASADSESMQSPAIIKTQDSVPIASSPNEDENISLMIKTPTISEDADRVGFSNVDNAISTTGIESTIDAPKTIERLEQIASESAERRKAEEEDDMESKLTIGNEVRLEIADINDLNRTMTLNPPVLDDVEMIA